jgi:hypothetical protein
VEIDVPHYLEKTNNTVNRQKGNAVRFADTIKEHEDERTKFFTTKIIDPNKKRHKYGLTALSYNQNSEAIHAMVQHVTAGNGFPVDVCMEMDSGSAMFEVHEAQL